MGSARDDLPVVIDTIRPTCYNHRTMSKHRYNTRDKLNERRLALKMSVNGFATAVRKRMKRRPNCPTVSCVRAYLSGKRDTGSERVDVMLDAMDLLEAERKENTDD